MFSQAPEGFLPTGAGYANFHKNKVLCEIAGLGENNMNITEDMMKGFTQKLMVELRREEETIKKVMFNKFLMVKFPIAGADIDEDCAIYAVQLFDGVHITLEMDGSEVGEAICVEPEEHAIRTAINQKSDEYLAEWKRRNPVSC